MHAKRNDKIATVFIYIFVAIVICILAGILGEILITGLPHLSWHFFYHHLPLLFKPVVVSVISSLIPFIY